ncbi:MAG: aquaporin [Nostocaceae cyanobacterium]|nr:aquaporin [Nostocaceae cyanobacterium]
MLLPVVLTFMFLMIILGTTDRRARQGLAPVAIAVVLTLIHPLSLPVTNTSVNPSRSLGLAIFVDSWAIAQLWMFWIAPILGAGLAGFFYSQFLDQPKLERQLSIESTNTPSRMGIWNFIC